ncbi:MAG: GNAT family N-acetyltransferase [Firmicutes bacterium]|nr:GNAT family N-acetyltransferase [Bacillota bacterium]
MRTAIEPVAIDELATVLPLWREAMEYHARLVPFFRPAGRGELAWQKYIAVSMAKGEGMLFVARTARETVGFICGQVQSLPPVFVPGRLGYISDLYVKPPYRRHGLGRLLYLALSDWFRQKGVTALDIHVYLANPEGVAFWRKMGFSPYAEKRRCELG